MLKGWKPFKQGFALLAAGALLAGSASQAAAQEDLKAVFEEAKAAYRQFKSEAKDLTISQTMELMTFEGLMTMEAKVMVMGPRYRLEMRMPLPADEELPEGMSGLDTTLLHDGQSTWMMTSMTNPKILSFPENRQYQPVNTLWDLILENGEPLGAEMLGNYDCFTVRVTDPEGDVYHLWIEKGNWNLIQAEGDHESVHINWWNSDFREVHGGWQMPFVSEFYTNSSLTLTTRVQSVDVNTGLEENLFETPAS